MPGEKIRVALLKGGKSAERQVSLDSGAETLANLDQSRFEAVVYDPACDLARLLQDAQAGRLDVAFPILHGPLGEDGAIQGFLELLELPYVGSGILASALAMDKEAAKKVYREAGLPVAPDLVLAQRDIADWAVMAKMVFHSLGAPLVVKPLRQGSSVGLGIVRDETELEATLKAVFKFGDAALLEKYLPGREFTCAALGSRRLTALPPIEIIPAPGHLFFDYAAKYEPGQAEEICPAVIPPGLTSEIQRLTADAHRALGCRGLSRSDFIFSEGQLYLLETNTLPGLTAGSLVPKMARAYGLTFAAFISFLLDQALRPEEDLDIRAYL